MLIFICWSGTRSKKVAEALSDSKRGLRKLVPAIETFYSDQIEKGGQWPQEIEKKLNDADAGLICVTPENARAPWIHYEAGRLAACPPGKKRKNIYTYLIDADPRELTDGPLGAYQSTLATYDDTRRMVRALVDSLPEDKRPELTSGEWEKRFREWWEEFQAMRANIAVPLEEAIPDFERRFRRKTFDEPLPDCSNQSWLARYEGARETFRELKAYEQRVETGCRTHVADLYRRLLGELDGYAMDLSATLLIEKNFPRDPDGRVAVEPPGAMKSCEGRRQRIKAVVADLVDPSRAPEFEEAVRFQYLETFQEKKNLIHRKRAEIKDGSNHCASDKLNRAANSDWDFDRIVFYLAGERGEPMDIDNARRNVEVEFEKLRSKRRDASLIPLHYSLGPLGRAIEKNQSASTDDEEEVKKLLTRIEEEIEKRGRRGQINEKILEIRHLLERHPARSASRPPQS